MKSVSCFIRKNTPELQQKLKELCIRHNDLDDGDRPWIAYNHGMWISVDKGHDKLFKKDIDCGYNEKLFLYLASIRNDTDRNQWFICTEEYISTHTMDFVKIGTWQLNTRFDKLPYGLSRLWRKAKPIEIVEHFKEIESSNNF